MLKIFGSAAAALTVLALAGCGTSGSDDSAAEPTKAVTTTQTPEPVPTTEGQEFKPRKASCKVKSSNATATLEDNERAVVLTFDNATIAATDTTGFYATVYDKAGENGGQIGAKYLDGDLIAYFTAVETEGGQTNMTGKPELSGKRIIMTFPKSKGGLGDIRIAKWSATFTLAGNDVFMCPSTDFGAQRFPA
jgi:predicted small lipoprotein YifL